MRPTTMTEVPVLIAGAGPAGLMTAVTLARMGVECVVAERRGEPSDLPRATVVSTRSMELLRAWGLEDEVRAGGVEAEWRMWVSETLARAGEGHAVDVGLPTSEQATVVSPTRPACVPQDHLEAVLLRHLRTLGPARVLLGTEIAGIDSVADGVRVVLRDAVGEWPVRSRYLVAADGAHSTARGLLGIAMHGSDDLAEAVTVLFRAPLWEMLGDLRYGIYDVTAPEGAGSFLPAGPGDRWLYGAFLEQDLTRDAGEQELVERIRRGAGAPDLAPRVERIGGFSFTAKVAERFRLGDAFLVGDAAHRVTPRGGTGMNTAMHDGFDLGWRLAWVLSGWADPGLLDGYESERRPVAEHNCARSADPGGTRQAERALDADIGGRIDHAWLPGNGGRTSTLDLLGPGLTLLTGPDAASWTAAAGAAEDGPPVVVHSLDAMSARRMSIPPGGALLARGDGVPVGWWGATAPADALLSLRLAIAEARGAPIGAGDRVRCPDAVSSAGCGAAW